MKLSINWLRELVDLGNLSAEEISKKLTLHTCEVEEVVDQKKYFEKVFAGKLISAKKHPNSDKLNIGQFNFGEKIGQKQIIFGQVFPLIEGEIYLVALDGAKLKSGIEIQNSEIRGEKSEGMVCTNKELGMKNDDFIRLNDVKLIGHRATEIFAEFADQIIDVDNKSLTHRPDLMGHLGIARELSAIFEKSTLRDKESITQKETEKVKNLNETIEVDIQTNLCRRFCSLKMNNVKVFPSEYKKQIRLENLETRAISNLVDITNLILLGLGQPMHIFDASKIRGKIIVRQAKNGEKLVALDEETYNLTEEDIVIADEEKVLSIAGIMGGLASGVTDKTTEIIFESANFDPTAVRKTSQRLALRSESSTRYEKSLDPEQCLPALLKAASLVKETCPQANIVTGITDNYPSQNNKKFVNLNLEKVREISGIEIDNQEIINILTSLGFITSEENNNKIKVEIPSFRATKDINIEEDLIEEVVRIYGFENIKSELPYLPISPPIKNKLRDWDWKIRDFFVNKNYLEVYHSSFVGPQDSKFTEDEENYVKIANPSNDECKFLRQSLISNFVRHLKPELRMHEKVRFFEIGKTYTAPTNESPKLAVFRADIKGKIEEMFYELKADFLEFVELNGLDPKKIDFVQSSQPVAFAHPHQSADIIVEKDIIGTISSLHPAKNPVKKSAIVFLEIDTKKLVNFAGFLDKKYQKMSSFPSVNRDISVLVGDKVLIGDLEKAAHKASELLKSIKLFDEFVDTEKFGLGNKNLAFHLVFRSAEKTLTEEEIENNFNKIITSWREKFGAQLRLEFDQKSNKI